MIFWLLWLINSEPQGEVSGSTLTVTGSGEITSGFIAKSGNYQLYKEIFVSGDISSIGPNALYGCSSLTTVHISSTVRTIYSTAFCFCPQMKRFIIDPNNYFFRTDSQSLLLSYNLTVLYYCPAGLTTVKIPTTVKYMQERCFHSTKTSSIHIPYSVISMGSWIATDCSLKSITFDKNMTITKFANVFCWSLIEKIEIPASIEELDGTFSNSRSAKVITFAEGSKLKRITSNTFTYCVVQRLELPEGLIELQSTALSLMTALEYIKIPSTLSTMPSNVFASTTTVSTIVCDNNPNFLLVDNVLYDAEKKVMFLCSTKATSVEITKDMVGLSTTLFQGCKLLTRLEVSKDNPNYFGENGVLYTKDHKTALSVIGGISEADIIEECETIGDSCCLGCSVLKTIHLKEGLKTILSNAFSMCGIASIHIPASVTSIGSNAFYMSKSIKKITFADDSKLTSIEKGGFSNSGITSIRFPKLMKTISDRLFYVTSSLTSVEFEENCQISTIGIEAFQSCSLEKIEFGSNVKTINSLALNRCTFLKTVIFPPDSQLSVISKNAFLYCNISRIELPLHLSYLQTLAFKRNTFLDEVIFLGNSITELPPSVFEGCTRLRKVILPYSLQTINPLTFTESRISDISFSDESKSPFTVNENLVYSKNMEILYFCPGGVERAILKEGLQTIGQNAFYYALSLVNLTFPVKCGVKEIPSKGFYMCISLSKLLLPESIEFIRSSAFYGCSALQSIIFADFSSLRIIEESGFEGCSSLEGIHLPNNLTSMGTKSFSGCAKLEKISFDKNCQLGKLEMNTFEGCVSLREFEFPELIESVVEGIFKGCTSLDRIKLKNGRMKRIENNAFKGMSISTVEFEEGMKMELIGDYAFSMTQIREIVLPSVDKYGIGVFAMCNQLTNISFAVKDFKISISEKMFEECNLLSINISSLNIERIDAEGFKGCRNIVFESTPALLTSIGRSAFEGSELYGSLKITPNVKSIEASSFIGNELNKVIFCGNTNIGVEGVKSFDQNIAVFVPFGYVDNEFCGAKVAHILDGDCMEPTMVFTAGDSIQRLTYCIAPLLETDSQGKSDE